MAMQFMRFLVESKGNVAVAGVSTDRAGEWPGRKKKPAGKSCYTGYQYKASLITIAKGA